jgi:hypothetical protein
MNQKQQSQPRQPSRWERVGLILVAVAAFLQRLMTA